MKLTTDIETNIYEVLAEYKVKIENAPFIAILKFAKENGGTIDSNLLYEELLKPLSIKACENLLKRLTNMGYFDLYNNEYELSDLGDKAAQRNEYYEERRGILRLYIVNNEFIPQKVVKIKELREDSYKDDNSKLEDIKNTDLDNLQNSQDILTLNNGNFILNNFEDKCRVLKKGIKQLVLKTTDNGSKVSILDYEKQYLENTDVIKNILLNNEFKSNYDKDKAIIYTKYNKKELSLIRDITIKKPTFKKTVFNEIKIPSVKVSPKNITEAKKWHKDLLVKRINRYFLSDAEFKDFTNTIADEFELFKNDLKNSISKKELIDLLDNKQYFYKKTKLETIDYLNY